MVLAKILFSAIDSHKRSCIKALFKRIIAHCSDAGTHMLEKANLNRPFMGNGYPLSSEKLATFRHKERSRTSILYLQEHKGAVNLRDENSFLALHFLTTSHAFNWDSPTFAEKGASKHQRDFTNAWNTSSTSVTQTINLDPAYKVL